MKLLLVGNGKWAQNYISTLARFHEVQLKIANRNDWKNLIDGRPDGVIVCTPPSSHVEIACYSLERGLPTMIEKPLALSYRDGQQLKKYDVPILVNNLHLFSPAFQKICSMVSQPDIASIRSCGMNIGPFRDYSPLFDYGPHDLSMGLYLTRSVENPSIDFVYHTTRDLDDGIGDTFEISLKYFQMIKHRITIGNGGPQKMRLFEVVTTKGDAFVYDDLFQHKLLVNEETVTVENMSPLENALQHFVKAIAGYHDDRFGIDLSLRTLEILERCQHILHD